MTVPLVCLHNMVPNSHVVVHDLAIDAASGEDVVVSCQWANSCLMHTFESSQLQGKNDLNSTTENVHAFLDEQGHCTSQSWTSDELSPTASAFWLVAMRVRHTHIYDYDSWCHIRIRCDFWIILLMRQHDHFFKYHSTIQLPNHLAATRSLNQLTT